MQLLKFEPENLITRGEQREAGMDFSIVTNVSSSETSLLQEMVFAVRSDGHALPIEDEYVLPDPLGELVPIYSLGSVIRGFPVGGLMGGPLRVVIDGAIAASEKQIAMATKQLANQIMLPPGYLPAPGAHKLLGLDKLKTPTRLFRYTSTKSDPYFDDVDTIRSGTYLTSFNDQTFVNSGFGAVGRYSLPMPTPARYKHDYTFPVGTRLQVGTVGPQFGQAGGGVEVQVSGARDEVVWNGTTTLDDY